MCYGRIPATQNEALTAYEKISHEKIYINYFIYKEKNIKKNQPVAKDKQYSLGDGTRAIKRAKILLRPSRHKTMMNAVFIAYDPVFFSFIAVIFSQRKGRDLPTSTAGALRRAESEKIKGKKTANKSLGIVRPRPK